MKCPLCSIDLSMAERQGVEIDYCPKCRGIWLDRGEIDTLIERSKTSEYGTFSSQSTYEDSRKRSWDEDHRKGHHEEKRHDDYLKDKGRKRKSLFEEIFDFGD